MRKPPKTHKPSPRKRGTPAPAEDRLKELALHEWGATFNAIADPISIHDGDFRLVRVNSAVTQVLGEPAEKLLGRKCYEVFHGTAEPWQQCPHRQVLENGKPAFEEFFEPRLKMYLHVSCSPVFDGKGRMTGSVHVARDITQVRRAAEQLQSVQQEQIRVGYAAMDVVPIAVIVVDAAGPHTRIIYANRVFEEMTGYTRAEVVGRNPCFLRGPHVSPVPREEIERVLARANFVQTELLHYRKDGTPFWVLNRVGPIRNVAGTITHLVETLVDITEMRKAEMELEHQREELLRITRVGKMGELASSIAHEVNQPLTAILSNAQTAQRLLALEEPDLKEVREILDDIVGDDRRAGEIIRKMRSLLKKRELEFERLDVNQLIRETAELVNADAVIRSKVIRLDLDERAASVRGDRVQLQQVLLNLITNGLDAMVESGPVAKVLWVRSIQEGTDSVLVEVEDSGVGVPEQKMDLLFRHFYTTKPEGMGMGLPISRSIIEAHGGRLTVRNNPDRGATFYFTLPVYSETS